MGASHGGGRVFMLFPENEIALDDHAGARLLLFEGRADVEQLTARGQDRTMQTFACVTLHTGEIAQACRGIEIERIDVGLAHQFACLAETLAILVKSDGNGLFTRRTQQREFFRCGRTADTLSHYFSSAKIDFAD
jgi:hypothetical protein